MAIQREYNAPQFGVQNREAVQQSQVAQADTRFSGVREVGDSQWRDSLLQSVGNNLANLATKYGDMELQNLYMEGQAKAGIIKSEEEISGNPLTRDWEVAGYRDSMGKLALADTEAQFNVDIQQLRQQPVGKMQEYLTARRNKMVPMLGSMSREARASLTGQLVLQDSAATKKYTAERTKFIIEEKQQAVATQWNTTNALLQRTALDVASGSVSMPEYTAQLRGAAGVLVGSVWADKSLPKDVQQELTSSALLNALSSDNVDLYEYLSANPIQDEHGGTLQARLTGDQQLKLGNAYREAYDRNKDRRNLFRMEQLAQLDVQLDKQNFAYQGSYDDLNKFLSPLVLNKTITGEKRQQYLEKFLDAAANREDISGTAEAYTQGNSNGLYNGGKSLEDGFKATEAMLSRNKATPEQRLQVHLTAGVNGMQPSMRRVGEILGTSLRQLRSPDGTVLPQHLKTVQTIMNRVRSAEAPGETNLQQYLLEGLQERDRAFVQQVFSGSSSGMSWDEAVQKAVDRETKDASVSPAIRAARAAKTSQEVAKGIEELGPRGLLSTAWTYMKSIVSADAAADLKLRPLSTVGDRDGWMSDSPTIQAYTQGVRDELAAEATAVAQGSPSLSAADTLSVAKANLAQRTISTKYGPVVFPKGIDIGATFGVGAGNAPAIGPALDKMFTPTKAGASWQLAFTNGRLFAQEFDRQGERIGTGAFVEPAAVQAAIREQTNARLVSANEAIGQGREVKLDGVAVRFNGQNTVGVPSAWMFMFREGLVAQEGVRKKQYVDTVGVDTVGIGVSKGSPWYPKVDKDGVASEEDINASFLGASNDAARAGAAYAKELNVYNAKGFALLSELSYQAGTAFLTRKDSVGDTNRTFAEKLKGADPAAAKEAFMKTRPYAVSGKTRRAAYMNLIEQAMKGK